eukprot:scaffold2575_cov214-Alexandrium_tamarense.AAC.2
MTHTGKLQVLDVSRGRGVPCFSIFTAKYTTVSSAWNHELSLINDDNMHHATMRMTMTMARWSDDDNSSTRQRQLEGYSVHRPRGSDGLKRREMQTGDRQTSEPDVTLVCVVEQS